MFIINSAWLAGLLVLAGSSAYGAPVGVVGGTDASCLSAPGPVIRPGDPNIAPSAGGRPCIIPIPKFNSPAPIPADSDTSSTPSSSGTEVASDSSSSSTSMV